jgi:hypothetical protein
MALDRLVPLAKCLSIISFRSLTGLAVGLALKELRYLASGHGFAPGRDPVWVPRSPSPSLERRRLSGKGEMLANAYETGPCPIEKAPKGLFRSGSVSRILSWTTIYLATVRSRGRALRPHSCGLPGSNRAGSTILFGLAPDGVCLAAASPRRRCALTAPFHLCLFATHVWLRHRPCVSVALSRGFPRVVITHRPRPAVSGLSSKGFLPLRSRPTHTDNDTAPERPGQTLLPAGVRPCGTPRSPGRGWRRRWS